MRRILRQSYCVAAGPCHLIWISLLLSGCSRTAEHPLDAGGLPDPSGVIPVRVSFDHMDGTTALRNPTIATFTAGRLNQEQLAALRSALAVRTWPELTLVDTRVVELPPNIVNDSERRKLQIVPADELEARWYVASVASLPNWAILVEPSGGAALLDAGASLEARFRPDSAPAALSINICLKDMAHVFLVQISEDVVLTNPSAEIIELMNVHDGRKYDCSSTLIGAQIHSACAGVTADRPLRLRMSSALASTFGVALAFPGSGFIELSAGSIALAGECRWHQLWFGPASP